MLVVPTQPVPNQTFSVVLANQQVSLAINQTDFGLFMTVNLANVPIATGLLCEDRNRMLRESYLGFVGDFQFYDLQGTDPPLYTGLGTRWLLVYLEASDLD